MDGIERMDERDLLAVWNVPGQRRMWEKVLAHTETEGNGEGAAAARQELGRLPQVSELDALRANARLVAMLEGRRWLEMQAAREHGASWADIGEALGMSRQGAWEWYQRHIEHQEKYVPDFHDAARARAALGSPIEPAADADGIKEAIERIRAMYFAAGAVVEGELGDPDGSDIAFEKATRYQDGLFDALNALGAITAEEVRRPRSTTR